MSLIRLTALDWICFALLVVGALNWGVLAITDINTVDVVLGVIFQEAAKEFVVRVIYALVGLAGIYVFYPLYRISQEDERRSDPSIE